MKLLTLILLLAACGNGGDCSGFTVIESTERKEGVPDAGPDLEVMPPSE